MDRVRDRANGNLQGRRSVFPFHLHTHSRVGLITTSYSVTNGMMGTFGRVFDREKAKTFTTISLVRKLNVSRLVFCHRLPIDKRKKKNSTAKEKEQVLVASDGFYTWTT